MREGALPEWLRADRGGLSLADGEHAGRMGVRTNGARKITGGQPEHMPSAHRRYAEWTPERMQRQARGIGPNPEALILAVLSRRPHPEQGFRTCLGVLRLFRSIDAVWAEAPTNPRAGKSSPRYPKLSLRRHSPKPRGGPA